MGEWLGCGWRVEDPHSGSSAYPKDPPDHRAFQPPHVVSIGGVHNVDEALNLCGHHAKTVGDLDFLMGGKGGGFTPKCDGLWVGGGQSVCPWMCGGGGEKKKKAFTLEAARKACCRVSDHLICMLNHESGRAQNQSALFYWKPVNISIKQLWN